MAETTEISWCDSTFNPWEGCQKAGPGCDNCYAEARNARFAGGSAINWGSGAPRRRTSVANWRKPVQWNAKRFMECGECGWRGECAAELFGCGKCGSTDSMNEARRRVFCASLADVFDNAVPAQWRIELFKLIEQTPNLDWLLLTKRVGNVGNMLPVPFDFERLYPNVRIGATIVNREEMLRDGPKLKALGIPNFWSVEPLLGDLGEIPRDLMPDWVIVGGESGAKARPMHPEWARSLRDQCASAGVPFLYKQHGEWLPACDYYDEDDAARDAAVDRPHILIVPSGGQWHVDTDGQPPPRTWIMHRVGKKAAGRLLDGVEWNGYPEVRP